MGQIMPRKSFVRFNLMESDRSFTTPVKPNPPKGIYHQEFGVANRESA